MVAVIIFSMSKLDVAVAVEGAVVMLPVENEKPTGELVEVVGAAVAAVNMAADEDTEGEADERGEGDAETRVLAVALGELDGVAKSETSVLALGVADTTVAGIDAAVGDAVPAQSVAETVTVETDTTVTVTIPLGPIVTVGVAMPPVEEAVAVAAVGILLDAVATGGIADAEVALAIGSEEEVVTLKS